MASTTQPLNFGATLTIQSVGPASECGSPAFWQAPLDEMYAQMPFPSLHQLIKLLIANMDAAELDQQIAAGKACLEDYDPARPGYQVAAGLYTGNGNLAIGLFPNGWTTGVYTGPARPLTEAARLAARRVLPHEFGHFYADQCRYASNSDDIARLITARFRELRPHQAAGDNEHEDLAEVFRAICGSDECRGTFSDGKLFTPTPQLRALIRCMYWLAANLRGCWVAQLIPQDGWVWFQVWVGAGWRWRCVSATDWHQQEWNGSAWVRI